MYKSRARERRSARGRLRRSTRSRCEGACGQVCKTRGGGGVTATLAEVTKRQRGVFKRRLQRRHAGGGHLDEYGSTLI